MIDPEEKVEIPNGGLEEYASRLAQSVRDEVQGSIEKQQDYDFSGVLDRFFGELEFEIEREIDRNERQSEGGDYYAGVVSGYEHVLTDLIHNAYTFALKEEFHIFHPSSGNDLVCRRCFSFKSEKCHQKDIE